MKRKLVLLHGWGVNSRIWDDVAHDLQETFEVVPLDLMGYGELADQETGNDLSRLAKVVLQQAPDSAIWCGWSFGGMVAMAAALQQPQRIEKLVLVCTTPRFMQTNGWEHGASQVKFNGLANQFEKDYSKALTRFLLLQLGRFDGARAIARDSLTKILQEPQPSWRSLEQGLNLLRTVDQREQMVSFTVETQIIVGTNDQIIPAGAGRWLASVVPNATIAETNTGHVPFLTDRDWFVDRIQRFSKAIR